MMTITPVTRDTRPSVIRILSICIAALLFAMAGATASASENIMIVSVDTNRILQHHPALQEAQQEFQGEIQQIQQQLQEMGEEERMMAQQMMEQQLQQRGQELEMEARDKVREDIRRIAEEKGYSYVVDTSALILGGKDITEEVMEEIGLGQ